jgi:hypothetical protein
MRNQALDKGEETSLTFARSDAGEARKRLQAIFGKTNQIGDCDNRCSGCALLSNIKAGKGTQCALNILQL